MIWFWDMRLWLLSFEPAEIEPVILADPDDDAVLACAVAAHSGCNRK